MSVKRYKEKPVTIEAIERRPLSIRQFVYRHGWRPKPGSWLFSPSLATVYMIKEGFDIASEEWARRVYTPYNDPHSSEKGTPVQARCYPLRNNDGSIKFLFNSLLGSQREEVPEDAMYIMVSEEGYYLLTEEEWKEGRPTGFALPQIEMLNYTALEIEE